MGADAEKLSKRHGRTGVVTRENGSRALWKALDFLGQQPAEELKSASAADLLRWGVANFEVGKVSTAERPAPALDF